MLIKLSVSVEQDSTHFTTERVSDQDELIIGRDMAVDLQIPYTRVSRRHCAIKRRGPEYFVLDLGSSHGTTLRGRSLPANEATPLRDGDVLSLAGAEIHVSIFEESGDDTAKRLVGTRLSHPRKTPRRTGSSCRGATQRHARPGKWSGRRESTGPRRERDRRSGSSAINARCFESARHEVSCRALNQS